MIPSSDRVIIHVHNSTDQITRTAESASINLALNFHSAIVQS